MAAAKNRHAAKPQAKASTIVTKPDDPLTWLYLNPARTLDEVQFGVLRKTYGDRVNTAAEFGSCKLQPVKPKGGDLAAITAERVDVVLPTGAEHRLADPRLLLEVMDQTALSTGLLAYVTVAFPQTERLHEAWESARAFANLIARERKLASVVMLHAPGRVGSANAVHAHLLVALRRVDRLSDMALGEWDADLGHDRGQAVIEALWQHHVAEWLA